MAMLLSSTVCTYICTCIYDDPVPIGRAHLYWIQYIHAEQYMCLYVTSPPDNSQSFKVYH